MSAYSWPEFWSEYGVEFDEDMQSDLSMGALLFSRGWITWRIEKRLFLVRLIVDDVADKGDFKLS